MKDTLAFRLTYRGNDSERVEEGAREGPLVRGVGGGGRGLRRRLVLVQSGDELLAEFDELLFGHPGPVLAVKDIQGFRYCPQALHRFVAKTSSVLPQGIHHGGLPGGRRPLLDLEGHVATLDCGEHERAGNSVEEHQNTHAHVGAKHGSEAGAAEGAPTQRPRGPLVVLQRRQVPPAPVGLHGGGEEVRRLRGTLL